MARPQQKPQAASQPGLKVIEKDAVDGPGKGSKPAQDEAAAKHSAEREAAARKRLHPARVWPD